MRYRIRGHTSLIYRLITLILLFVMVLTTLVSPVFADPPDDEKKKPVEHLVVVSNSQWFLNELQTALENESVVVDGEDEYEENGNGSRLEASDHRFIYFPYDASTGQTTFDAGAVKSAVTDLRGKFPNSEVSVAFWMGFDEVDDVTTFTHEILVKKDLVVPQKNTVEYQEEVPDPLPDDPDHTKWVTKQKVVDADENQYTWEIETETHWKKAAERYKESMESSGLREWLTSTKVKDYWIGLPPNAVWKDKDGHVLTESPKICDGMESFQSSYISRDNPYEKDINELYGHWADKWNTALSTAGSVVDIWDAAVDSKLYYTSNSHMVGSGYHGVLHEPQWGTPSGEWVDGNPLNPDDPVEKVGPAEGDLEYNAEDEAHTAVKGYRFYSYTDESYQTLFHIVLENIANQNKVPVSEEAIPQDMYSISTALTAYVSNTLSANAGENQKDHKLPDTFGAGNAGAYIGYGDKDRGFQSGIYAELSKNSTVISYDAMNSSSTKDMLTYARYGKLLHEMGIDEYGIKTSGLSVRMITGLLMMVVFVLSLVCTQLFGWLIDLLIVLNPFRFFAMVPGVTQLMLSGVIGESDAGLGGTLKMLTNSSLFQTVGHLFSSIYNGLTSWSWALIVPLSLAILIASLFLSSRLFKKDAMPGEGMKKTGIWFFRVAFIAIGVPLLGMVYTAALVQLDGHVGASNSASTEIVGSTFVDFEAWAETSRLSPIDGGTFETVVTDKNVGGSPSDATIMNLRETASALNKANGVISVSGHATSDVLNWNRDMIDKNVIDVDAAEDDSWNLDLKSMGDSLQLLLSYMEGDFYYPSDWESMVGSELHAMAKTDGSTDSPTTGRRKGGQEKDFKAEEHQGDKTYYNMYDSINEVDDWTGRKTDENTEIFEANKKWVGFNILNNGGVLSGDTSGTIRYSDTNGLTNGTNPSQKGGLSTLSMYNYLSSRFTEDGVVTYSNENAVNMGSKYSHYSVTLIGSGVVGGLYYANAFALMMVMSIIGLCYVIGAVVNILKKGLSILGSIPAAALGSVKSIATVISVGISMTLEVCMIGFLYLLITELLYSLIDIVENAVMALATGGSATIATITLFGQTVTMPIAGLMAGLIGLIVLSVGCSVLLWKYRKAWYYGCMYVTEKLLSALVPEEVLAVRESRVKYHEKFTESYREWVASVAELLYNKPVTGRCACVSCRRM